MATLQDLLDDLNDRLNDAGNTQATQATKIRWLNHGIAATWPRLYRAVSDTITIAEDDYSYDLPSSLNDDVFIYGVEVEVDESDGRYTGFTGQYKLPEALDDRVLEIHNPNGYIGHKVRIRAIKRLSSLAVVGDTYDGPPGTEELPVLYAMGIASSRRLDDRLTHTRYSTVAAQNGVDTAEMMNSHQFWFAQFDVLLDNHAMPWPTSREG